VKTRERIEPFPNTSVPMLIQANLDALATFDDQTAILEQQFQAAAAGKLWWDPESSRIPVVVMNKKLMEWYKQASKRGKLLHPEDMVESAHTFSHEQPLMVKRA